MLDGQAAQLGYLGQVEVNGAAFAAGRQHANFAAQYPGEAPGQWQAQTGTQGQRGTGRRGGCGRAVADAVLGVGGDRVGCNGGSSPRLPLD